MLKYNIRQGLQCPPAWHIAGLVRIVDPQLAENILPVAIDGMKAEVFFRCYLFGRFTQSDFFQDVLFRYGKQAAFCRRYGRESLNPKAAGC